MKEKILITQMLCPERHCIFASVGTGKASALIAALDATIAEMIENRTMNPHCGICGAPRENWHIDSAPARASTMDEAVKEMLSEQALQQQTRAYLDAHRLTYDSLHRRN